MSKFNDVVKQDVNWPEVNERTGLHYRTTIHPKEPHSQNLVVIRIGKQLMIDLNWRTGDRVKMVQNDGNPHTFILVRSAEGCTLTPASVNPVLPAEEQFGGFHCSNFGGLIYPETEIPRTYGVTLDINDYDVTNGGEEGEDYLLMIDLPEKSQVQALTG